MCIKSYRSRKMMLTSMWLLVLLARIDLSFQDSFADSDPDAEGQNSYYWAGRSGGYRSFFQPSYYSYSGNGAQVFSPYRSNRIIDRQLNAASWLTGSNVYSSPSSAVNWQLNRPVNSRSFSSQLSRLQSPSSSYLQPLRSQWSPSYSRSMPSSYSWASPTTSNNFSPSLNSWSSIQQLPTGQAPAVSSSWSSQPSQNWQPTVENNVYSAVPSEPDTPVVEEAKVNSKRDAPYSNDRRQVSLVADSMRALPIAAEKSLFAGQSQKRNVKPAVQGKRNGQYVTICNNGKIIGFRNKCNKKPECKDSEDELGCDWHKNSTVETLTGTNNFNTLLRNEDAVLVEFFAPWCPACITFLPTLEKLKTTFPHAVVRKVNTDEDEELRARFDVTTFPRVILFKKPNIRSTYDKKLGMEYHKLKNWLQLELSKYPSY